MQPDFPPLGFVATFYSFKGGVGRSFLLANVATTLAAWGYRVLCVDWDLEAPGLDLYFADYLGDRPGGPGLVDLVHKFKDGASPAPDWSAHVTPVGIRAFAGSLHLMPAGRQDDGYAGRVQALDWANLYERGLGAFLESVRDNWVREYDVVLIDSRTGITDIGGICTIQLPDILVPVLAANRQNLLGVADVVRRARERRESLPLDRPALLVLPILSRFEPQVEYDLSQEWVQRVAHELGPLTDTWRHKDTLALDVLTQVNVPYVPFWSYGEKLAVLAEPKPAPTQISYPVQSIAALLARRLHGSQEFLADRDSYVAAARKPRQGLPAASAPMRLFLSSTVTDLEAHRAAVIDAVKRLGATVDTLAPWPATAEAVTELIRRHIRECDVFVGMYGFRYGFVPDGFDESVTEIEYREAVAENKPVVSLMMADDAPVTARDIDRGAAGARVDRFRADLATQHSVHFFKTPEEAAVALTSALTHLSGPTTTGRQPSGAQLRIYISYRRQDSWDVVSRLHDLLTSHFGHDSVFTDIASIPVGVDFRQVIADSIRRSTVMLVVIGPEWLSRMADPNDFVRLEVGDALRRGIIVVPVLVDEAAMPAPAALPLELRELAFRNGTRIRRGTNFAGDVNGLTRSIEQLAGVAEIETDAEDPKQPVLPVYLLLDCSGSMLGEPISAVQQALADFINVLAGNPETASRVRLSVISFASDARVLSELAPIKSLKPISLQAGGATALGQAIDLLNSRLEQESTRLSLARIRFFKPLGFLLTDGSPTDNWEKAASQLNQKRQVFLVACAAGPDADIETLKRFADVVVRCDSLSPHGIASFFQWSSNSITVASRSPSQDSLEAPLPLPPPPDVKIVP